MSDVTGTDDTTPATPLVVPPRTRVNASADPTGTTDDVPAVPLVVPPLMITARPTPSRSSGSLTAHPAGSRGPTRLGPRTLPVTGSTPVLPTLASLAVTAALWLRQRSVAEPRRDAAESNPAWVRWRQTRGKGTLPRRLWRV